jgi:hypothetical protein
VLEFAMSQWGVSPVEIVNTWSDELLYLMSDKLFERMKREQDVAKGHSRPATGKTVLKVG